MNGEFNPMSSDAMFAKVLARLDEQDRAAEKREALLRDQLGRIELQAKLTNGRVSRLEQERWVQRGAVAVISIVATTLWGWFSHK